MRAHFSVGGQVPPRHGPDALSVGGIEAGKRFQEIITDHQMANPEIIGEAVTIATPTWTWSGATGGVPGSKQPLTAHHAFRIASVTKPFVAAAILRLMEMGKVDITRSVDLYVSGDTATCLRSGGYDPAIITARQLLSHTSGICNFAGTDPFIEMVESEPHHRWTRGEQIQLAIDHGKPEGEPGSVVSYSDTGYVILGEIIERQTGKALGQAVRDLIDYGAVGLADTYWEQTESRPRRSQFSGAMLGDIDMTNHDHSFDLYGGGGLISTNGDLVRFFQALLEGRVFQQRNTLAALLTVPSVERPRGELTFANGVALYPFGRFIGFGHQGHWGQFAIQCPENGVTIAWSTNHSGDATNGADVRQQLASALGMT